MGTASRPPVPHQMPPAPPASDIIHKFIRDKYSKRFPELESLVPNALDYIRTVKVGAGLREGGAAPGPGGERLPETVSTGAGASSASDVGGPICLPRPRGLEG